MSVEQLIITNLITNEEYNRKVIPFIDPLYFEGEGSKIVFGKIVEHMTKYNTLPTLESLVIDLDNDDTVSEGSFEFATQVLSEVSSDNLSDLDWMVDTTETFCKDRALYNAIKESISIIDGGDKEERSTNVLPDLLSDALGVSFDQAIGHDFLEDWENRFDLYHEAVDHIPFDIEMLNTITKGGVVRKTLNVLMAGVGVGKTLSMCHMAAANLTLGKNVLYITMEMSQERIGERIDANLMDIDLDDLQDMSRETYERRVSKIQSNTSGKLIIKEYPTAAAGAAHFRHLLNELKLKKKFVPDIIYIDYLNICTSTRLNKAAASDSYTYIKHVAEELRGLAVERNVAIITATQLNRSGFTDSDPGMESTAESFGLPATADLMIVLVSTEELLKLQQIMFKQLKNRYRDESRDQRFVVGCDKSRMKLHDVEQAAQNLQMDVPVMDNTAFGEEMENRQIALNSKTRKRLGDMK